MLPRDKSEDLGAIRQTSLWESRSRDKGRTLSEVTAGSEYCGIGGCPKRPGAGTRKAAKEGEGCHQPRASAYS